MPRQIPTVVMLSSLLKLTRFHLIPIQFRRTAYCQRKVVMTADKVYLRNDPSSQDLHINFRYANEELKIDRDFNFCRKMDEKLEGALNRIRGNIEKEFNKKLKKGKKKTPAQVQEALPESVTNGEISIEFRRCNDKLEDVTFAEMLKEQPTNLTLKVLNQTFDVVLNRPWVINIVLPTSIMAGFTVYPSKLEMKYTDKAFCKTEWLKAKMPTSGNIQHASWTKCGEGFSYETSNEDVGHHLKFVLTPGNAEGHFGPVVEQISKNEIQAGPGQCPFETRHFFTQKPIDEDDAFRVVSYNILADLYADSDYSRTHLFPYCPPYALKVDYRKQLYIKELLGYNADIMCLQEVDMKIFEYDLKPVLEDESKGFKGVIAQKGSSGEGIATFFRTSRFDLIETYNLNIGEHIKSLDVFSELWTKIQSNEKLVERICDRATTLQLSLLKMKTDKYILVANTHLYFHPDADHIRLLQFGFSMLYVEDIYKKTLQNYNLQSEKDLSIVFCGDFNSVPECGIYCLMTQRFVDKDFVDWGSNAEEAVKNVSLSQPFAMDSACGTPDYTNYTHLFAACLDYIFYQCDRLEVKQYVPLPSNEELKANIAIPSVVFPSDHVALIADLKFKH